MNKNHLFLAIAIATTAVAVVPAPDVEAAQFKDVKKGSEMAEAIEALLERNVISGYKDGTYRPNNEITRAQAAKILALALRIDTNGYYEATFEDVPESHPNFQHIYALAQKGIINANVKKFNPSGKITREQMAKMIAVGFNLQEGKALPFKDIKSEVSKKYVGSLYHYGITSGKTKTNFGAKDAVTRGQMALFIHRAEQKTASARAIFTNDQFGATYINGNIIEHYSDESINIKLQNRFAVNSWIVIDAVKPGTSYFYIGGREEHSETDYVKPIHYYRADVTLVDGKLKLTTTELDEPLVEPDYYFLKDYVTDYELTNVDGTPVDKTSYKIVDDGSGKSIYFYGEANEYLIHEMLEDGRKRTVGIKYTIEEPESKILYGSYRTENFIITKDELVDQYIEDAVSLEVLPFVNGWDEEMPGAVTAELINGEVHVSVYSEGVNKLKFTTANGKTSEMFISATKFADGYLIQ